MKKKALFLDRDGVINLDHGYVHKPQDIEFVEGIFTLVSTAKRVGYLVVVVTNQAGIGRGFYSETDFHFLMTWMNMRFVERCGQLDAIYFCPDHPEFGIGKYRKDSLFRKPEPGMLLQAQKDLGIDMGMSILVGDKPSDVMAGEAAGVGRLFLLGSNHPPPNVVTVARLVDVLPYLVW